MGVLNMDRFMTGLMAVPSRTGTQNQCADVIGLARPVAKGRSVVAMHDDEIGHRPIDITSMCDQDVLLPR